MVLKVAKRRFQILEYGVIALLLKPFKNFTISFISSRLNLDQIK